MRICLALLMASFISTGSAQSTVISLPAKADTAATSMPAATSAPAPAPAAPQVATPIVAPAAVTRPAPAPSAPQVATPMVAPAAVTRPAPAPAAAPQVAPPAGAPAPVMALLRGQITLTSGGRPLRSNEAVDAVVYFRPATPVPLAVPNTPFVIKTERKTFAPRVLPIPVGASVRFPNNDPILHNVFSTTKEASFDLGLYGRSDGESYRFSQPGVIRVFCNVHHAMVAHVLVMDTPFFAKPDEHGRFRLVGVPPGPGELYVWHERSQLWRSAVVAGTDEEIVVPLELSKRRVPPHLNKTGQPYRRTRPDEY